MPYETPFSWHGKRAVPEKPPHVPEMFRCARCGGHFEFVIKADHDSFCYPCVILTLKEFLIRKNDFKELDGGVHETR